MSYALALVVIVVAACDLAGSRATGLGKTARLGGPVVVWDLARRPLAEIPLPNDFATRLDASAPTGRRLNVGLAATTRYESRLRALFDNLDGFGAYAPITVSFDQPLDLADLREYQAHDDVRHIDWNVTARQGQPHVRVFTEDREMAAWFLLDLSPSVDFGSGERRKRDLATEFTTVLARLLTRHGNRVGALLYGAGVDTVIPTGNGRRHVLHLLHSLAHRPPGLDSKLRLSDAMHHHLVPLPEGGGALRWYGGGENLNATECAWLTQLAEGATPASLGEGALAFCQRLAALGVQQVFGNDSSPAWCTVSQPSRFFSHRRDRISGRMAACIWLV
jgi:hypothetical protein